MRFLPNRGNLKRLTLLAASLVAGLLVCEAVVRAFLPQALAPTTSGLYAPDPPGRYRLRPGFRGRVCNHAEFDTAVTINAFGLRGEPIAPAASGCARVLVVGDSFAFGMGVEDHEAFPHGIDTVLSKKGFCLQCLNGGTPGFALPDEVGWIERHGRDLAPDLILVAVFLGNDIQDAARSNDPVSFEQGMVFLEAPPSGLTTWFNRRSHLFRFFKKALPIPIERRLRKAMGLKEPWRIKALRSEFEVYAKDMPDWVAQGKTNTLKSLQRLVALSEELDAEIAAVLLPNRIPISPGAWEEALAQLELEPAAHDPSLPRAFFRELFAANSIPALDLTDPFTRELARGAALYYRSDGHFTREGHALAARLISAFLDEKRLL